MFTPPGDSTAFSAMQVELTKPSNYGPDSSFSSMSFIVSSHQVLSLKQFISLQAHLQPQKARGTICYGRYCKKWVATSEFGLDLPFNLLVTSSICPSLPLSFLPLQGARPRVPCQLAPHLISWCLDCILPYKEPA